MQLNAIPMFGACAALPFPMARVFVPMKPCFARSLYAQALGKLCGPVLTGVIGKGFLATPLRRTIRRMRLGNKVTLTNGKSVQAWPETSFAGPQGSDAPNRSAC
jgi:hypothetical protein